LHAIDNPHEDPHGWLSLMVLMEYVAQYHERAMTDDSGRAAKVQDRAIDKDPQNGTQAADKQISNLAFLARNFGLKLPHDRVPKFHRLARIARRPPRAARPVSLWMTMVLEEYILRPDITDVMANIAGILLFCIFGGHRTRQAQCQTWFYEHNGVLFCSCDDKSGSIHRTFTPTTGIRFGDHWFRRLQSTIAGAEHRGFVFRQLMMMSFICSCRNKNRSRSPYIP
jgi:hypothetical protein